MRSRIVFFPLALVLVSAALPAQVPDNLVLDGVPPLPSALPAEVGRYLEFRTAGIQDWHPHRREMLVTTRFAEAAQLHVVAAPGRARRQLTFLPEPVSGGSYDPQAGAFLVFSQDTGGGEFYQLYRYDFADGRVTLLTDGQSRNIGPRWSPSGQWLAYTSTRRNGRDTDIYVMNPRPAATGAGLPADRLLVEIAGGGWSVLDWSPDETQLLIREYLSVNESRLYLCEVRTGVLHRITPESAEKVAWSGGLFARDAKSLFVTTDLGAEFRQPGRFDLATRRFTPLTTAWRGDVEAFDLSPDGRQLAFIVNEDGASGLYLLDARSGKPRRPPRLPLGVISGLKWHRNSRDLGFTLSSARSPADAWSLDTRTGKIERWTESESGGLNPEQFVVPERVRVSSFDGLEISGFLYRPDPRRFPGPRPVLVNIHGGPESQARPVFQARHNYWMSELGVAVLYPNARGSSGYGKTFLTLDNGFQREDSVRDIGAFLDWIARDPGLDASRVAVIGASYGGYMTLACLVHYGDRLRCGVDMVGISNFLTFLQHTQAYRRDLRRAEYGDERDPAMAEFLARISPANQAARITLPLFVAQGLNDPRVPASESEQMVRAIRAHGGQVWYLLAKDEGHGFRKKRNVDHLFYRTVQFVQEHLLR